MKITYIIILFLVVLNFSCSEEVKPTPYTYTQIFTGKNSKTWKLKFLEQTFNGDIVETFNISCASDDQYTFYANAEHSYKAATGSKKCSDGEANTLLDSWTFNNASATLTMLLPFFTTEGSLPFIVRGAKKNKMELEIFFNEEGSESYRIHFEATDED